MADALAVSAAVLQFLDIAIRLSVKLSWICSELKDVPHWLVNLKEDLNQQIAIARHLQFVQASLSGSSPTGGSSTSLIDEPLANYVRTLGRLDHIIQSISDSQSAGTLKKSWNALLAVHKRRDVLLLCENLERKKSTISLWLGSASAKLSSEILQTVGGVRSTINTMLALSTKVDETASNTHAQLGHLPNLVQSIDKTSSEVALLAKSNVSNQETALKLMSETRTDVQTLIQEWGDLQSMLRDRSMMPDADRRQVRTSHSNSAPVKEPSALIAEHQNLSLGTSHRYISSQGHRWDINTATTDLAQLTKSLCRCSVVNQTVQVQPVPKLQLRKVLQRHHYRQCPKSRNSEKSLEFIIRIILPTWLLSHIINLSMAISWGSDRGWKISHMILGTSRIVDLKASPAFQAIRRTRDHIREFGSKNSGYRIRELENTLGDLFQSCSASPLDVDCNGNTLLYEFLDLVKYRYIPDVNESIESPWPAYLSLARYLLDSGANPNILRSPAEGVSMPYGGGTALDMFSIPFFYCAHPQASSSNYLAIHSQLVKNGGHFSRAIHSTGLPTFESDFEIFRKFEAQSEAHGLRNSSEQLFNNPKETSIER